MAGNYAPLPPLLEVDVLNLPTLFRTVQHNPIWAVLYINVLLVSRVSPRWLPLGLEPPNRSSSLSVVYFCAPQEGEKLELATGQQEVADQQERTQR